MVKLKILDMKNFLETINACTGEVHMLGPDSEKVSMKRESTQRELLEQYRQNNNYLPLTLEILNPTDYMHIISYYAGDC